MDELTKKAPEIGAIISADLSVPNADEVRDFYKQVVGWQVENMAMSDEQGDYNDYVMKDKAGNWAGGVCHQRGVNSYLPSQWLIYINVADIEASLERCLELGGKVLKKEPDEGGPVQYAVIEDPAGAVVALTKLA